MPSAAATAETRSHPLAYISSTTLCNPECDCLCCATRNAPAYIAMLSDKLHTNNLSLGVWASLPILPSSPLLPLITIPSLLHTYSPPLYLVHSFSHIIPSSSCNNTTFPLDTLFQFLYHACAVQVRSSSALTCKTVTVHFFKIGQLSSCQLVRKATLTLDDTNPLFLQLFLRPCSLVIPLLFSFILNSQSNWVPLSCLTSPLCLSWLLSFCRSIQGLSLIYFFLFYLHYNVSNFLYFRFDSGTTPLFLMYVLRFYFNLWVKPPSALGLLRYRQIISPPQQLLADHFYLYLFPDCIIWFQRLPNPCILFVICRYYHHTQSEGSVYILPFFIALVYASHHIPSHLSDHSTLSILSPCSSYPVFQGYIPVSQYLTGLMSFLISVSTAWVNNKHKQTFSSRQHYHKAHSMQPHALLCLPVFNRSAACLHLFSHAKSPQTPQTKIAITSSFQFKPHKLPFQYKLPYPETCDIIFLIKWNSARVTQNLTACHRHVLKWNLAG
ncbi:hypothetical protein VP01_3490g3 [Puccinia sorghi]|uniref:Uncharacterized protein n=1 Tax=Puccinia sorghi TaxID=27349 RepID=A0A0L6UWL8_9BASI|nr:hypothetical protein VP01_3490g3 [Puccinia sorghi]